MAIDNLVDMSGVGGWISAFLNVGKTVGIVLAGVIPLAILGYLIFRSRSYKIDVIILARRAGSLVLGKDKLMIKKLKDGTIKTRLMKRRININPIDFADIIRTDKGKDTAFIFKYGELDYLGVKIVDKNDDNDYQGFRGKLMKMYDKAIHPPTELLDPSYVQISAKTFFEEVNKFADVKLKPTEGDVQFWRTQEQRDLRARNSIKSILEKYGVIIYLALFVLGTAMVVWIIMGRLDSIAGSIAGAAKACGGSV